MDSLPPYPYGPFTPELVVGGNGGQPFESCKWIVNRSGLVVKGLDVWWSSKCLRGIQLTFSDGSRSVVYGNPSDSHDSVVFSAGEAITSMTLWANSSKNRAGRIRLTTNAGQTFDVGIKTDKLPAYDVYIGSGILVGMVGRCATDIDMLGAVFLKGTVTSISISKVAYDPPLSGTSKGISEVTLDAVYYHNLPSSTHDLVWDFTHSVTRTVSTSFTQSTSTTYGASASISVSAEIFGIGPSASGGFEWQSTDIKETTTTTSSQHTMSWSLSGTLHPGEGTTVIAVCQQGLGNVNYTSTVTLQLEDGTVSTYDEPGVFNNVVYTKAMATSLENIKFETPSIIEYHRRRDIE
ncbi:hypothetical protein OBBRIDRAFT_828354 [Obba rivulosa]|uniref:Jacalin-type lectin domain-containing protein n=1 Tax=Obba rivulosa TaxID=1052685 RepID=A0A8E2AKN1_9APHY|nr:hypothetical protein OBBRIDRAFT_828354 [Obba rivulosa]